MAGLKIILNWAFRVLRGALITLALVVGLGLLALIVVWEADVHTLRDRYEYIMLAVFGAWSPDNWCPPGRKSDTCDRLSAIETRLEKADYVAFVNPVDIEGTKHSVVTEVRFTSARDVIAGRPGSQRCYLETCGVAGTQALTLAEKSADDPPAYTPLSVLNEKGSDPNMTGFELGLLARSHCQFSNAEIGD